MMALPTRDIVLIADDFALSEGVSAGITRLARAQRITGTSALVTLPRWNTDGAILAELRDVIAIGLHMNLTLGLPLGNMPSLAPEGRLPDVGTLVRRSVLGRLDRDEIAEEIVRQLRLFEAVVGHKPDFIDGHQHVHALPGVRDALIATVLQYYRSEPVRPLIRVPGDDPRALLRRPGARGKAMLLTLLSGGFARALAAAGLPANASFAGVTAFGDSEEEVRHDLEVAALEARGGLHLVMCHPGVPDAELAAHDPVTTRRGAELAVLSRDNPLTDRLRLVVRATPGGMIDWREEGAVSG
ncbi:MAG: ChbG/HpnK family deacetylase [Hyphomicrobiaceae bacterium]|nr:ChbG/HpnK family deacetylase [Hyphomicrobiaceae bacterium]MCC0007297.1 ChbG/HpnK family deacetylase [Hyphomicrobiaceae bacterium]